VTKTVPQKQGLGLWPGQSGVELGFRKWLIQNGLKVISWKGKDNFLFPSRPEARGNTEALRCRERLGGLLKYYEREAA
jgi:hypothetical protein